MPRSDRWFDGDDPTDARELTFLESVRAAAGTWGFDDLRPEGTATSIDVEDGGLVVEVRVPHLSSERRTLRVAYDVDAGGRPSLVSGWTSAHAFEDCCCGGPDADVDLYVVGVDADPEQCGRWAAAWFARQLRRPVVRREWDRPRTGLTTLLPGPATGPAYVEWTVADPDRPLDAHGGLWSWLARRPAAREVRERPRPEG